MGISGGLMLPNLTFRVVLESPPSGVDYGVQIGRGAGYEIAGKQRANGKDLRFEFVASVRGSKPGAPDFGGPVVQGPKGQRFAYLVIGTYAGQTGTPWRRKLKVPLTGIAWDAIDRASDSRLVLEARVPGTAKDGGPACATVKPFDGWKLVR
jgi:hypothetical protein